MRLEYELHLWQRYGILGFGDMMIYTTKREICQPVEICNTVSTEEATVSLSYLWLYCSISSNTTRDKSPMSRTALWHHWIHRIFFVSVIKYLNFSIDSFSNWLFILSSKSAKKKQPKSTLANVRIVWFSWYQRELIFFWNKQTKIWRCHWLWDLVMVIFTILDYFIG